MKLKCLPQWRQKSCHQVSEKIKPDFSPWNNSQNHLTGGKREIFQWINFETAVDRDAAWSAMPIATSINWKRSFGWCLCSAANQRSKGSVPHALWARHARSLFWASCPTHIQWSPLPVPFDCASADERWQTKVSREEHVLFGCYCCIPTTDHFLWRRQCSHGECIGRIVAILRLTADVGVCRKWGKDFR